MVGIVVRSHGTPVQELVLPPAVPPLAHPSGSRRSVTDGVTTLTARLPLLPSASCAHCWPRRYAKTRTYVFPALRGVFDGSENGGGRSAAGERSEGLRAQTVHGPKDRRPHGPRRVRTLSRLVQPWATGMRIFVVCRSADDGAAGDGPGAKPGGDAEGCGGGVGRCPRELAASPRSRTADTRTTTHAARLGSRDREHPRRRHAPPTTERRKIDMYLRFCGPLVFRQED